MIYHGPQPKESELPQQRFGELERLMKTSLELWFCSALKERNDVWVRLGVLQIYLEHGLPATLTTICRAVEDCERLEAENYPSEWQRCTAVSEALAFVKSALIDLREDTSGSETERSLPVNLQRDTLLPIPIGRNLQDLWKNKAGVGR